VILLRLPPLRERGDDIPLLADHYLKHYSAKYGRDVRQINAQARDLMRAYPWPGNVRELSHVIERAVLWSQGDTLDVEHLSLSTPTASPGAAPIAASGTSAPAADPLDLTQWERTLIERALAESNGNQTKAAQLLGITRDTLRYRLKKFGLGG
jgi:DNA-binding NtrC family response regulator